MTSQLKKKKDKRMWLVVGHLLHSFWSYKLINANAWVSVLTVKNVKLSLHFQVVIHSNWIHALVTTNLLLVLKQAALTFKHNLQRKQNRQACTSVCRSQGASMGSPERYLRLSSHVTLIQVLSGPCSVHTFSGLGCQLQFYLSTSPNLGNDGTIL
jgi:hypothetical protein